MSSANLCDTCKSINWPLLFHNLEIVSSYGERPPDHVIHHSSLASLLSTPHCELCLAIAQKFQQSPNGQILDFLSCPVTIRMAAFHDRLFPTRSIFGQPRPQGHIDLHFECGLNDSPESIGAFFDVCASTGGAFAHSIPGRLIQPDPMCLAAFSIAQDWFVECCSSHVTCKRPVDVVFPTRVLGVGKPGCELVTLQEFPIGTRGRYAALSHCWGRSQTFTTTKKSLEARKAGIPLVDLPQTFRDAVLVTQRLGIGFIWIDSLCIVQDDTNDWERESAVMGTIYRNALIVIAASRADSDEQGFLSDREPSDAIPINIMPHQDSTTGDTIYLKTNACHMVSIKHPIAKEPLIKRAWVLQERYLAERTLFFGKEQMYWACSTLDGAEYGSRWPRGANSDKSIIASMSSTSSSLRRYTPWCNLLQEYSKTALTKDTDRLPALQGLANHISQSTGSEYYFGIWLGGLIPGLLWRRLGFNLLSRPGSDRAPSWSWASVDGFREFPLCHIRHTVFLDTMDSLATYQHHDIRSRSLRVAGPIFAVTSTKGSYDITNFDSCASITDSHGLADLGWPFTFETFISVSIDLSEQQCGVELYLPCIFDFPVETDSLSVLFLAQHRPVEYPDFRNYACYFGLVLRTVDKTDHVYQRVGMVEGIFGYTGAHHTDLGLLKLYDEAEEAFSSLDPNSNEFNISINPEFYLAIIDLSSFPKDVITLI